jgi:hypothetical protein
MCDLAAVAKAEKNLFSGAHFDPIWIKSHFGGSYFNRAFT